jgi:hypothetical protein
LSEPQCMPCVAKTNSATAAADGVVCINSHVVG